MKYQNTELTFRFAQAKSNLNPFLNISCPYTHVGRA